jgi:hypothetical protein
MGYVDEVLKVDPEAAAYFRFFQAPGVGHCYGGTGPVPADALGTLRAWVENGTAPDVLHAASAVGTRPLCVYPKVQTYVGNSSATGTEFACMPPAVAL